MFLPGGHAIFCIVLICLVKLNFANLGEVGLPFAQKKA
jgi:hypothetical protein